VGDIKIDDSAKTQQLRAFGSLIRAETYSCPIATSATFLGKIEGKYAVRVVCSDAGAGSFYVPTEYILKMDQELHVSIRPIN
jgi:hypothetical protein